MATTSKYVLNAGTAYPGNFGPKTQAPFDARTLVNTYNDLLDGNTWKNAEGKYYIYNGLTVTVKDTGEIYVLKGANIQPGDYSIPTLSASNWVKSGTTYTAGSNIQISNSNEISATDTTYTSSDFDIKDLSDSTGLKQDWSGKQDALTAGDNIEIYTDDLDNKLKIKGTYSYTLPTASTTELGGIKVGEGLHMSGDNSDVLKASIESEIKAINYDEINFNSFRNAISEEIDGVRKAKANLTLLDVVTALLSKKNDELKDRAINPPTVTGAVTYTLTRGTDVITIPETNIISYEVGTKNVEGTYTLKGDYSSEFTDGKVLTHIVTNGLSKDSTEFKNAGCTTNGNASWSNESSLQKSANISFVSGDNVTTSSITLELAANTVTLKFTKSTVEDPTHTEEKSNGEIKPVICSSWGNALYPDYASPTNPDIAIPASLVTDTVSANSVTISTYFNQYMKVNNDWTKISNNKEIAADFKNGTEFYILSGTPHIKYYSMVVMDRNINYQPNDWESGSVYLALPGGNSPTFTVEKPTSGLYKAYTKFKYKGDTVSKSNMTSGSGYNAGKFKITIL